MQHQSEGLRRTAVMLDPHPLCHAALATVLSTFNIDLVAATTSTSTIVTLLREHRPDLLVIEVDMPGAREEALQVIETGRRDDPRLTVIVFSATDDRTLVDEAFDRGASTYVLKTSDPDAIVIAVRQAFEPSLYFAKPPRIGSAASPAVRAALLRKLTRREVEIVQLVSGGRSNRQVAEILWVTDQTVKFHLANVYRKLGVRSRFEAANWAREHGLVDAQSRADVAAPPTKSARDDPNAMLAPLHQSALVKPVPTGAGETSP